jgi:hypothetical protein
MPQLERDVRSGAVVIKYNERELEDHLGYRLMKLERRFERLEEMVEKLELLVKKLVEKFYI